MRDQVSHISMSKELSFVSLDVEDPATTTELLSTSEDEGYSRLGIASSSPAIIVLSLRSTVYS